MKTISIGLLLVSILNSPAEILIYKSNKTVTRNGDQATVVEKFGGFLVFDTETRYVVSINTHTVAGVKKFSVTEEFDYYLEQVFGAAKLTPFLIGLLMRTTSQARIISRVPIPGS